MPTAVRRERDLPSPSLFYTPAVLLGSWTPAPVHPKLAHLDRTARDVMKGLEEIAALKFESVKYNVPEDADPRDRERCLVLLDAMRSAMIALDGAGAKVFMRDLARWRSPTATRYIRLHEVAYAKMREWRAFLAFILDTGDDEELGYEFVPPPPPSRPATGSVALDLS